MDLQISITSDGIKTYPLHKHKNYEIMLYVEGNGYMRTPEKNYSFSPGTIIIVPPMIMHGSSSENGFKNICISGEFEHLFRFEKPVVISDNEAQDGKLLAALIYNNRYGNNEYLYSLCSSYIYFLLQNLQTESSVGVAVNKIIFEITDNAFDYNISLKNLLLKCGYAEDYIRAQFKKVTGKTPNEFLTKIRIERACFLINIYGDTVPLAQIAEQCGYIDYVYFSKKFKSVMGISPKQYKKSIH